MLSSMCFGQPWVFIGKKGVPGDHTGLRVEGQRVAPQYGRENTA